LRKDQLSMAALKTLLNNINLNKKQNDSIIQSI